MSENETPLAKAAIWRDFSAEHLSDTHDILAILQREDGDNAAALRTLRKSEQICRQHGAYFKDAEVRDDVIKDLAAARQAGRSKRRS